MSYVELQDLKNEVLNTFASFQERLDGVEKAVGGQVKAAQAVPAEDRPAIDRLNGELDRLMGKVKSLEAAQNRPAVQDHFNSTARKHSEALTLLAKCFRRGTQDLDPEEQKKASYAHMAPELKALYANDAVSGGFFATPDMVNELIKAIVLIDPFRSVARSRTTTGERVEIPRRDLTSSAYWAVEQQNFNDSQNPKLGMVQIPAHEMRAMIKVSQQDLEDSQFDLESFIQDELAEQFAFLEGQSFIKGDGVGKPEGIATNSLIAYDPSTDATKLTADSLLTCMHNLKSGYRQNGTWLMTTKTLGVIRLFKDSQNRPLWQPFASGGLPATIYDRPYIEMPSVDEVGANAYPVFFGDFQRSYLIVDRISLSVQRLNELYAQAGLIGFMARRRVGGGVLLPEAIRKIKISVS